MLKYQTIKPGDVIVSTPNTDKGLIFNKTVILIISHDKYGTSGVIINKILNVLTGDDIVKSLQLPKSNIISEDEIKGTIDSSVDLPIYFGGPIEQEKGIILHSSDYNFSSSIRINQEVCISTSSKIIKDIILNKGPINKMLILGYASWAAEQLTSEIKRNDWLVLLDEQLIDDPKVIFQLLFIEDPLYKWQAALKLAGVSSASYLNYSGNA